MKRFPFILAFLLYASTASAYEYKLAFTPPSGARGIVVAGYQFNANNVVGNCSYYTSTSGSGRGGHTIVTHYNNICTWDLFGNLVSLTPGVMTPTAALYQSGTELVYAVFGTSTTGVDGRGFGFVSTPSSHYTWSTMNGYATIPDAPYTATVQLVSDGDIPLAYSGANISASVSGLYNATAGTATVVSSTCPASIPTGSSCSVSISYAPTTIKCTGSPYGYAYTKIDLALISDAGVNTDLTEGFTITGVPMCDD